MSKITIIAFKWVPPFAQGLVRDLRVRWALEEAGLAYEQKLLAPGEQGAPEHRVVQPFGQVPVYQEGDLTLFESGSIVMHIAHQSPVLLPADEAGRAKVLQWLFAALNSVEPHVLNVTALDHFFSGEEWAKGRRPSAEKMMHGRLEGLSKALGSRDYLLDRFTAADLVMTTVLRFLRDTGVVAGYANLAVLQARCEARPAFQRALAAQMANFEKFSPQFEKPKAA
jgi:glutathione S-transferase